MNFETVPIVMNSANAMSLKIPAEFERAVMQRVESGQYPSPEAVLSACLELLEREENDYDAKLAWLQRELDVAIGEIERGEGIDGEQAFAEALAEYQQRMDR